MDFVDSLVECMAVVVVPSSVEHMVAVVSSMVEHMAAVVGMVNIVVVDIEDIVVVVGYYY